jgi:hypothetical protein
LVWSTTISRVARSGRLPNELAALQGCGPTLPSRAERRTTTANPASLLVSDTVQTAANSDVRMRRASAKAPDPIR